ncbi:MAG: hypothetical protein IT371_10895 [Deltaproteobacteria bacterium]|nr:hypothetical protein [Deltaproteobacteria bacterium]
MYVGRVLKSLALPVVAAALLVPTVAQAENYRYARTKMIKQQIVERLNQRAMPMVVQPWNTRMVRIRTRNVTPDGLLGAVDLAITWKAKNDIVQYRGKAMASEPVVPQGYRHLRLTDFQYTEMPRVFEPAPAPAPVIRPTIGGGAHGGGGGRTGS